MIFLHIGGGAGDLNPSTNFRDGFSEFVKSHKSKNKNIFINRLELSHHYIL